MANKKLERLLVVEDTPFHLNEAKRFFSAVKGLKTEYAETVEEALGLSEFPKGGKLYRTEFPKENKEFFVKIAEFKKQNKLPNDFREYTRYQERKVKDYVKQLKSQGISRDIGGGRIPLVDGVITDLLFPYDNSGRLYLDDALNGLLIAATCKEINVPCVICTAGYHHGKKYEWANQMNRAMGNPNMIDCYIPGNNDAEGQHKNWKAAYKTLREIIEGE